MLNLGRNKVSTAGLNKMLRIAGRMKKLTEDKTSGWADFCLLLDDYVGSMLDHKKNFNLTMASDEQINMLKLHDRDIWLIKNYIQKIPRMFIDNLENEIKRRREEANEPEGGL